MKNKKINVQLVEFKKELDDYIKGMYNKNYGWSNFDEYTFKGEILENAQELVELYLDGIISRADMLEELKVCIYVRDNDVYYNEFMDQVRAQIKRIKGYKTGSNGKIETINSAVIDEVKIELLKRDGQFEVWVTRGCERSELVDDFIKDEAKAEALFRSKIEDEELDYKNSKRLAIIEKFNNGRISRVEASNAIMSLGLVMKGGN